MKRRGSGILLHITSLPSPYGIGDMGPWAYKFADFLSQAKQHYWQILPLNPVDPIYGNSPYHSISAFANNHGKIFNILTREFIALMTSGVTFLSCAVSDLTLPAVHKRFIR